jgi:anti-sigma B factor antagonist
MPVSVRFVERVRSFDGWARYLLSIHILAGLLFVILGLFWIYLGVFGAVTSVRFHGAREITGEVVSIHRANTYLSRFDVAVAWSEGGSHRQTVLRVPSGTEAAIQRNRRELAVSVRDLKEGDSVKFLLRNEDQATALPSERRSPGGLIFDFILGVLACVFGAGLAATGEVRRSGSLWPEALLQRAIERITGVPFPADQPKVVKGKAVSIAPADYRRPPPAELTITARARHGIAILDLTGVLGGNNWEILDLKLSELLNAGTRFILLNLAKLEGINSLGQGLLLHYVDTARAAGGEMKFANPSEGVRSVLEQAPFADVVEAYPEEDDAVASFERKSAHSTKRAVNLETETKEVLKTESGPIIQVSFSGDYPPGSAGNYTAASMYFWVARAVRNFQPAGVIFDLSLLRYTLGDAICEIVLPLLRKQQSPACMPYCFVARGGTAKALAALVASNSLLGMAHPQILADAKLALDHLVQHSGLRHHEFKA